MMSKAGQSWDCYPTHTRPHHAGCKLCSSCIDSLYYPKSCPTGKMACESNTYHMMQKNACKRMELLVRLWAMIQVDIFRPLARFLDLLEGAILMQQLKSI